VSSYRLRVAVVVVAAWLWSDAPQELTARLHRLSHDLESWSRFTVAEQMMGGGSSCSAPRLRSKSDVAHVKADFFPLSLPLISGT
jgi:hypothetical protein